MSCVCLVGEVLWQQNSSSGVGAVAPALNVPDLNGDNTDDIALLTSQQNQVGLMGFWVSRLSGCLECDLTAGKHGNVQGDLYETEITSKQGSLVKCPTA